MAEPAAGESRRPNAKLRTSQDLAAYLDHHRLEAEIVHLKVETPTVDAAAAALGVTAGEIIKSLVFDVEGQLVLVVAGGPTRVQPARLASLLGVPSSMVKLAAPQRVAQETGYPVGGVPPFGHAVPLRTFVDATVMEQAWVWGGGGESRVLLRVQPQTIVSAGQAQVVDLQSPTESQLG